MVHETMAYLGFKDGLSLLDGHYSGKCFYFPYINFGDILRGVRLITASVLYHK